jgi:hypothetical protein
MLIGNVFRYFKYKAFAKFGVCGLEFVKIIYDKK